MWYWASKVRVAVDRVPGSGMKALVAILLCIGWMPPADARPVEGFNSPLDLRCEAISQCSGVVRAEHTLGRYTGISVAKRGGGSAAVTIEKNDGVLRFESREASPVVLTLSWDGDQHPDQLSGAGLNCLDLTQGGAYAFVISGMSIESECHGESPGQACPNFQIESRVYDARDPTGQRYSVSMMTRSLPEKIDLVVPFSNFIREGPRGKGDVNCVGAVSISLRFEGFDSVELELGPIYTNGSEGLTPLPTPTVSSTDTPQPAPTAQVTSTMIPTVTAANELIAPFSITPGVTQVVEVGTPAVAPTGGAAITSPIEAQVPAATEDEEVTYGQLVEGE